MPNIFIAQVISNVIKVILITTKYSYKTYFGHILTNSQPFLMVQGRKLMEICVGMWSNTGFHERLVATNLNWFFIGPMIILKTGQLATH